MQHEVDVRVGTRLNQSLRRLLELVEAGYGIQDFLLCGRQLSTQMLIFASLVG